MTTRDVAQVISDGAERICQSIDRLQPPLPPTTVDQRLTVIAVIDLLQDEDTETLCHRTDSLIGRPRWCHRLASRAKRIHPPHAARSTAPNLSRLYGDADFDLKSGVLTTPNSPPARPRSGQPDRVLGHAAPGDPRGDPGDAQGSRVSQPEASCTRGAPAAEKPNRPPTPFGRDSLTYPLFTATGFRGDSSPLDDRRAAWAQCGLRDVDVLPEIKRCG